MKFPRLVFRSPGPNQCQGGTYAHVSVADQEQLDARLAEGWHATLPDALAPPAPPAPATSEAVTQMTAASPDFPTPDISTALMSRDQMKAKAAELGIEFKHNISNVALAELIDAAPAPKV